MEHRISEDSYDTIGMVHDVLLAVYAERKENIRLISARLAAKTEGASTMIKAVILGQYRTILVRRLRSQDYAVLP